MPPPTGVLARTRTHLRLLIPYWSRLTLTVDEAQRLVHTHLPHQPSAPQTTEFADQLAALVYSRNVLAVPARSMTRLLIRWFRSGEDLVLLRNVLLCDVSTSDLLNHLDGTHRFDPDAMATLAALIDPAPVLANAHASRMLFHIMRNHI